MLIFQSFGAPELLIILAIVVVLFGATRIGDIGKGLGRGIREFRREIKDGQDETRTKRTPRSPPPPTRRRASRSS